MNGFLNMFLIPLLTAAVLNGTPLLYGTVGEILTEKSGNLNLGVEGMMYMGGAFGLGAAFYYEKLAGAATSGPVAVAVALAAAFAAGAAGALVFSFLTVTLRANQNVTGLALTIFGTGVGQFMGQFMREKEGGFVALSNALKDVFQKSPFPAALQELPVVGKLVFGYNIFVYLGLVMAIVMWYFLARTRAGLKLRSVGESPATADTAGINVTRYKYLATIVGGGISAIGGMVFIMTIAGAVWNHEGLSGEGWLAVALVIFCLWSPLRALWSSVLFGGLMILYVRLAIPFIPGQLYMILPYVVTVVVLVVVSMRQKRENQPPASLGSAYFREER
ncbi:ABC transporter permease [Pseudoflavonifractor phocaeensis]|uniref:ABC transporter permease n=1 Tax=Pseudoflavonifractor phocaeensis TaxID=1870988 RepID=UPI003CC7A121